MRWLLPAALLAATLLAAGPAAAMPYVPQSEGTYDALYEKLTTAECRSCHGADTQSSHHASALGCTQCHYGTVDLNDCLACHTKEAVQTASETLIRGHHVTDAAETGACTTCHDPLLVADYGSVPPPQGPLDPMTAPCPENCRSCHRKTGKLQPPLAALDGAGAENLHHNPGGGVVTELNCNWCHDCALPHYDQRQIRVCANCHPSALLHDVHPLEACLGCHTPLTRLVYITDTYATDTEGVRTNEFAPGETVLYHITYDVVGQANTRYVVKAVVKFGKKKIYRARQVRRPGQGYEVVLTGKIGAAIAPGKSRRVVYKLKLRKDGALLSKDTVVSRVTVVSP